MTAKILFVLFRQSLRKRVAPRANPARGVPPGHLCPSGAATPSVLPRDLNSRKFSSKREQPRGVRMVVITGEESK